MKHLILIAVGVLALAACSDEYLINQWTPVGYDGKSRERAWNECTYEAKAATAPIRSALAAGFQSGFLRADCMKAKGFK